ncbi:hypothetical protein C5E10_18010 [Pseudoclavibacter sp. RFBG4]|uniref:M23 family metallopeptidase n=1 Tax=Pseudoclavibacter sp. RFBG4 TaxID=2080575 RepID=UPI000CE80471|nr:M23 family metallopeptidase [Pseudoclavibacter sp. RFBG4]PPG25965.1 hypothetical protein C5E10_18010 [Pseudoclavibacter sp. RFBG4]
MTKILDQKAPAGLELARRVKRHGTQNPAGDTSVTEGTFRVASDEGLIVEGSERITGVWFLDGVGEVTGSLSIFGGPDGAGSLFASGTVDFEGVFTAAGKNTLSGENLLSGPTKITGAFEIEGATKVTGTFETAEGGVKLGGPVEITDTLDVTAKTKLGGDTTIEGALDISGETTVNASLTVKQSLKTEGDTELGGTVTISGAATLEATLTVDGAIVAGGVRIESNKITVSAGSNSSEMGANGMSSTNASFGNLRITNLFDQTSLPPDGRWVMAIGDEGILVGVPQNVGGPMGDLEWPFDPEKNTDEFGPRVSPGGIGSTDHKGMDFGIGISEGTDIKAAGSGTVYEVGTGSVGSGGFGNYLVIQHAGNKRTLYAHMQSAPAYSVGDGIAKGAIVGKVGNTGSSTGAHLHLETHIDGVPVNPRTVITKPWSA